MKKKTLLLYLKISVLADLLLQYTDEFSNESGELKPMLKNLIKELDEPLSTVSNAMYEIGDVRRKNTIQEIQNKIDTIFRKTFSELSLIR